MAQKKSVYKVDLHDTIAPLCDVPTPVIRHAVVEADGVAEAALVEGVLEQNIKKLNDAMQFHTVSSFVHKFKPYGISHVVVLEESHIAIHTWPERGYIHLDVVTCTKEDMDLEKLEEVTRTIFTPTNLRILKLDY